jgi:hypothetical protein
MTEADWLACADPLAMAEFLRSRAGPRKLRLIACACCRHVWDRLADVRSRRAVEVAERFADGLATSAELLNACNAACNVAVELAGRGGPAWAAASAAARASDPDIAARLRGDGGALGMSAYRARGTRRLRQAVVLRDVMGPLLFRPVVVAPRWLAGADGVVPRLAQAVYDERAFDRLPVLADALEDAGCTDAEILGHCRCEGEHVRGCWVVDLMLGKS